MGDAHHCSGSEITYTVSSGTLNSSISYHTFVTGMSVRLSVRLYVTLVSYAQTAWWIEMPLFLFVPVSRG